MKLQNFFRTNLVVLGIAAALLFPRVVTSQEIENTDWNDGPYVAAFPQPAPAPAASDLYSAAPEPMTLSSSAMVSGSVVTREMALSQWSPMQLWMLASLLVCIAIVARYALAEVRRANRNLGARVGAIHPRPTLL